MDRRIGLELVYMRRSLQGEECDGFCWLWLQAAMKKDRAEDETDERISL